MEPQPPSPNSSSPLPLLVFVGLLLCLAGLLWVLFTQLRGAFDSSSLKDTIASVAEKVQQQVQEQVATHSKQEPNVVPLEKQAVAKNAKSNNEPLPQASADGSNLTFDITGKKLTVFYKEHATLSIGLKGQTDEWYGLINDPYQALIVFGCNPFAKETGLPINNATNVKNIIGRDGNWDINAFQSIKLFPFFSASPTTVCLARGLGHENGQTYGIELYMLDASSGDAVKIVTESCVLPRWLESGTYPPPYSIDRYLYLVPERIPGDNVTVQIKTWSNDSYVDDTKRYTQLAKEELAKAKLSSADIAVLQNTNVSGYTLQDQQYQAVAKLVRLFFYGKQLGLGSSLKALLERFHPTIRQALAKHPDLKP